MLAVSEDPGIVVHALNVDTGLIDVDKAALADGRERSGFCGRVIVSLILEESHNGSHAETDAEKVLAHLGDDAIRQPEDDPLINSPGLEAVAELVAAQPCEGRRWKMEIALRAPPLLPGVPRDRLPAAVPSENEIDGRTLGLALAVEDELAVPPRAPPLGSQLDGSTDL